MGTTTNYNFPYPESSGLVKDGWEDIKDLAVDVDTDLKTVADGRGLIHINTTTFSAVSSFSLAQDTFTSTYDNYKLIFTLSGNTADATPFLRMRKAGTDDSSGSYHGAWYGYRSNATSDQYGYLNQTSQSIGSTESNFNSYYYSWNIDIYQPKLSVYTKTWFQNMGSDGSSNYVARFGGVTHLVADAFDSVTIGVSSGNFSGVYSVYGYKK